MGLFQATDILKIKAKNVTYNTLNILINLYLYLNKEAFKFRIIILPLKILF